MYVPATPVPPPANAQLAQEQAKSRDYKSKTHHRDSGSNPRQKGAFFREVGTGIGLFGGGRHAP